MDSWPEFLELGRTRGWFWPENREFLAELLGEDVAKKVPIESRNYVPQVTVEKHIDNYEESHEENGITLGNETENVIEEEEDGEEKGSVQYDGTEDGEDTTEEGSGEEDSIDHSAEESDGEVDRSQESDGTGTETNTATSDEEAGEEWETDDGEISDKEQEDESVNIRINPPNVTKEVEESDSGEAPVIHDQKDEREQCEQPTELSEDDEVEAYSDEMASDDELQSLMLQEMTQLRQQRWAEQTQEPTSPLSDSESEQIEQEIEQPVIADSKVDDLSGKLASMELRIDTSLHVEPVEENPHYDGEVDESPVKVAKKQPFQTHYDDAESPPVTVSKRRTGRVVIVSDDDDILPPPRKTNAKPRPKVITIGDSDTDDDDKENEPASVNRAHVRITKRKSISVPQPPLSRTKQIMQSTQKKYQSVESDSESGSNSERSSEGRGDWIRSDEDRSEDDSDGDISDFVVPDDEVEADDFSDEEFGDDDGNDSGEDARSGDEDSEGAEEVEEIEESDEDLNEQWFTPPSKPPVRTPSTSSRTPSKPKTPASSKPKTPARKFYSANGVPKYPVIVPKTPQSTKKRNFDLQIARELYDEFNKNVFGGRLPPDLPITWSVTLRTTAGYCSQKRVNGVYSAAIDLALKVLDDMQRLRSTLLHEMCHAAVWMLDHAKESHGGLFYAWGRRVERAYPDITVDTCHNYDIKYKYTYECTNPRCGVKVGRHSKSLDTARKVCKRCMSEFRLVPRTLKDGTPAKSNTPSAFSVFLKDNLGKTKKDHPNTPHKDVMAILVAKYNELKIAK